MFLYLACLQLVFFAVVTGLCALEAAYAYMTAICLIYRQLLLYYLARVQLAFFAVVTGLCALEAAYAYMAVFFWYIGGYSVVSRSCTAMRLL